MSEDENINKLIDIIAKLELNAKERDNELAHAKRIIATIRDEQGKRNDDRSVSIETKHAAKAADTRNTRDNTQNLIHGVDIRIGDWVTVLNPRPGQPTEGVVVGKTRDNLIKIEGRISVGDRDVTKTVRRIPENIRLTNT